jgi:GNAT superfamily N-acetyltransferase
MKVEQAKYGDDTLLSAVNSLLPQLSPSASPLTLAELRAIVESDTTRLLIALDDGKIYGMLTLVIFRIPTGVRSWIEDVVVDASSRGKGAGKVLLETAVRLAREQGANTLNLTSNPSRVAANRLYRKAGFEQRDTNTYRKAL